MSAADDDAETHKPHAPRTLTAHTLYTLVCTLIAALTHPKLIHMLIPLWCSLRTCRRCGHTRHTVRAQLRLLRPTPRGAYDKYPIKIVRRADTVGRSGEGSEEKLGECGLGK